MVELILVVTVAVLKPPLPLYEVPAFPLGSSASAFPHMALVFPGGSLAFPPKTLVFPRTSSASSEGIGTDLPQLQVSAVAQLFLAVIASVLKPSVFPRGYPKLPHGSPVPFLGFIAADLQRFYVSFFAAGLLLP